MFNRKFSRENRGKATCKSPCGSDAIKLPQSGYELLLRGHASVEEEPANGLDGANRSCYHGGPSSWVLYLRCEASLILPIAVQGIHDSDNAAAIALHGICFSHMWSIDGGLISAATRSSYS